MQMILFLILKQGGRGIGEPFTCSQEGKEIGSREAKVLQTWTGSVIRSGSDEASNALDWKHTCHDKPTFTERL